MPAAPNLDLVPKGAGLLQVEGFEVAFADDAGEQRVPLTDAGMVPFEGFVGASATVSRSVDSEPFGLGHANRCVILAA